MPLLYIPAHAPRIGRDRFVFSNLRRMAHSNLRAPCGAQLGGRNFYSKDTRILAHARLVGRGQMWYLSSAVNRKFPPTRAIRGATIISGLVDRNTHISTHTPHAGTRRRSVH